ncbi:MAG: 5-(carboxyamino)imidazole ribonucleotide synthase [Chloroherpetonaceae bacterium]|nr:5-(carboxyamino)imidazole ribonucleotide synthase [Chloroherpetonaceae bacterium]
MKTQTIGILGGGQLARMTSYAAFQFGFRVAIFERQPESPAGQLTSLNVVGEWHDATKQAEFARLCHLVTLENEFIEAEHLRQLESFGTPVLPSPDTIARIQDKLTQKETLENAGLPVAPFRSIGSKAEAEKFGEEFGYPFLLKARQGGYDGYGNRTVRTASEIEKALSDLGFPNRRVMAEAFVAFQAELATMVARSQRGEVVVYPVVETVQENHICKIVKAPAPFEHKVLTDASELAREAILAIKGIGIFGVEMFLTSSGKVLINELAPRPHNSGHYTIEACITSQFENHLRAVLGYPLGSPDMMVKAAVMVNLLGTRNAPVELSTLPSALCHARAKVHIYGKKDSRIGRKMGHITVVGESLENCLQEAQAAAAAISL